jgi:hypothetical protein
LRAVGVDEVALCGEPLGDLAADAAAGSGDEDSFGDVLFGRLCTGERWCRDQCAQDSDE